MANLPSCGNSAPGGCRQVRRCPGPPWRLRRSASLLRSCSGMLHQVSALQARWHHGGVVSCKLLQPGCAASGVPMQLQAGKRVNQPPSPWTPCLEQCQGSAVPHLPCWPSRQEHRTHPGAAVKQLSPGGGQPAKQSPVRSPEEEGRSVALASLPRDRERMRRIMNHASETGDCVSMPPNTPFDSFMDASKLVFTSDMVAACLPRKTQLAVSGNGQTP